MNEENVIEQENDEKPVIFNGGEWMLKYNKNELIEALKDMACPYRTKGVTKLSIEKIPVVRTSAYTGERYDFLLKQHLARYIPGTDMSNYRLKLDGKFVTWASIKKTNLGLLRWNAFQMGLTEEHMEV